MNELSVTEEETIRGLLQLGWSQRRIARETGHHRTTIQRIARAVAISAAAAEPKPATDPKVATELLATGADAAANASAAKTEIEATEKPSQ